MKMKRTPVIVTNAKTIKIDAKGKKVILRSLIEELQAAERTAKNLLDCGYDSKALFKAEERVEHLREKINQTLEDFIK